MDQSKELDAKMNPGKPDADGMVWFDASLPPFSLYGLWATDPYRRMDETVAERVNPGVKRNNYHTAGGRVRFSTDSVRIGVRVEMPYVTKFCHMPLTGSSSFDVYLDTDNGSVYQNVFKPDVKIEKGFEMTVKTRVRGYRSYTLNFPLYSPVSRLEIGIDAGAALGEGRKYLPVKPIVYYGSSITQGACASRPGLAYQAIISRKFNIDFVNLGFSGNAKAEPAMMEYLSGLEMSAFVYDYDHNAPNPDHLRETHLAGYRTVREKNPDLPIIIASKPDYIFSPTDANKRREIIEDTFRFARSQGDEHIYYIDGDGFCRGEYEDSCSVDGTHPNDVGFVMMAEKFGATLREIFREMPAGEGESK